MPAPGQYLGNRNPDGFSLGMTTSEKVSLYGVDPIVQRASANQAAITTTVGAALTDSTGGSANTTLTAITIAAEALTDSTTGTANNTVNDVGAAFSQSTLNNNFADLIDEINKLRTDALNIEANCENNFADLGARVNELRADVLAMNTLMTEIRAALVALGAIKGSA